MSDEIPDTLLINAVEVTLHESVKEVYRALQPAMTWDDERMDWPLLRLIHVLAQGLEKPWDVAYGNADGEPAWFNMFDPQLAPAWALAWLAQFPGVQIEAAWSAQEQRDAIENPDGFHRGSPAAMQRVAARELSGTQTVEFFEQYGGEAYQIALRTYDDETPDPAVVLAALIRQKPAGLILDYASIEGRTFARVNNEYASFAEVLAENDDMADVLSP